MMMRQQMMMPSHCWSAAPRQPERQDAELVWVKLYLSNNLCASELIVHRTCRQEACGIKSSFSTSHLTAMKTAIKEHALHENDV